MVTRMGPPPADGLRLVASPMKLSATPVRTDLPPPLLGQHTRQVLRDVLNYPTRHCRCTEGRQGHLMANFILVHGAWHGAWCWRRVSDALVRAGHRAHAVTLTGLGERAHLLSSSITLETHITDVMATPSRPKSWIRGPGRAFLCRHAGHGRGGPHARANLKHLVYVDAVVPRPGESWSSTHASTTRQMRLAAARDSADYSFPPPDPSVFGLAAQDHAWVQRRQTPHPGHTYEAPLHFDPVRVGTVARTFVNCTRPPLATIDVIRGRVNDPKFWDGQWTHGAGLQRTVELLTGHDPMISSPESLTSVLLDCAG
jgi:hypothetical protein